MIKNKKNSGYTIIELLAVASLLVVITSVVTGILYFTLRGSNKTRIATAISQNGNYAVSTFNRTIIDSTSIIQFDGEDIADCTTNPTGQSITLRKLDGGESVLACAEDSVTLDGESLIDSSVRVAEGTCSFYCNQTSTDSYATPLVGISFDLEQMTDSDAPEMQGSTSFNSAVSLRNYAP